MSPPARPFAHPVACSYAVPHIPWAHLMADAPGEAAAGRDWRSLVARLLALTYAAAELALPVLAAAEGTSTDAAEVDADDVVLEEPVPEELMSEGGTAEEEDGPGGGGGGEALGPRAQVINTACWQTSKEAALLLGALAQALPIGGGRAGRAWCTSCAADAQLRAPHTRPAFAPRSLPPLWLQAPPRCCWRSSCPSWPSI